jgi:hypothetical protein
MRERANGWIILPEIGGSRCAHAWTAQFNAVDPALGVGAAAAAQVSKRRVTTIEHPRGASNTHLRW